MGRATPRGACHGWPGPTQRARRAHAAAGGPPALDAAHTASPRAAVDDLELESARRVADDEGLGRHQSADLAGPTVEEAPPTALGGRRQPRRHGGVAMPELAEPSEKPVAPGRALQAIDLMRPEWDEDAGGHGVSLKQTPVRRVIGRSECAPGCTTTQRMDQQRAGVSRGRLAACRSRRRAVWTHSGRAPRRRSLIGRAQRGRRPGRKAAPTEMVATARGREGRRTAAARRSRPESRGGAQAEVRWRSSSRWRSRKARLRARLRQRSGQERAW